MRGPIVSVLVCLLAGSVIARAGEAGKAPYEVHGIYVEGCSCGRPCACALTGIEKGCQGVGAMEITSGHYKGTSLKGVKLAYGMEPEKWIRIYLDVPAGLNHDAVVAFATAYGATFGKVEIVRDAKIAMSGTAGTHTVSVDDGKVLQFATEPIMGGDKKHPLAYSNVNDPLNYTFYQGKTLTGSFQDGDHKFNLKDSNSYFNPQMKSAGKM